MKGGRQGIRECKFTDMKRMRTVRSSYAGLQAGPRAGYSRGLACGVFTGPPCGVETRADDARAINSTTILPTTSTLSQLTQLENTILPTTSLLPREAAGQYARMCH